MTNKAAVPLAALAVHGDEAALHAQLDFAVNVIPGPLPEFVASAIQEALGTLAQYPAAPAYEAAKAAVARRFGVEPENIALLAGASEGFNLLTQLGFTSAMCLHPSFTEPEFLLRRAGIPVTQKIMGFTDPLPPLGPEDLVVLGNPVNPTTRLYQKQELQAWLANKRAAQLVVVDEAFLDLAGEEHSLVQVAAATPGLLVLRSLTKTYGLAGLRCGIALGEKSLISRLEGLRPAWPLGSLQVAAIAAVAEHGLAYEAQVRQQLASWRAAQIKALAAAGFEVVSLSAAPFMLVRPPAKAEQLRQHLLQQGISVRRADTFPGLDESWWRLAVREPAQVQQLLAALKL